MIKKDQNFQEKLICTGISHGNAKIERIFDHYVPITLRIGDTLKQNRKLYWRIIDAKFCLLELGIDQVVGYCRSLKVVFYNGNFSSHTSPDLSSITRTTGLPIFERSVWSNIDHANQDISKDFYDIHTRFTLYKEQSDIYISLFNETITYQVGIPSSFSFGFNHTHELCGIWLHNLDNSELSQLDDYFARNRSK